MADETEARRVLVVERDGRVRAALAALFATTPGLEVVAATASVADAAYVVRATRATVAVVDIDAARPDDDLATIHELADHVPVVAVSAATSAGLRAVVAGATAFCDKDVDPECLTAAVTAAVRRTTDDVCDESVADVTS